MDKNSDVIHALSSPGILNLAIVAAVVLSIMAICGVFRIKVRITKK